MSEEQGLSKKELRAQKRAEKLEKKIEEESRTKRESFMQNIFTWAFVAILGAGLILFVTKLMSSNEIPAQGEVQEIVITDADHSKGNPDSGVVLVEYGDFQCPACKTAHPFVEEVVGENIDNMLFVFRNLPLPKHRNAYGAARAAEAAGQQGKYFEMYDLLFVNQNDWDNVNNPKNIFEGYAEQIGLDVDMFSTAFNSGEVKNKIDADIASGGSLGVSGTPTFFLNGAKLRYENYGQFREIIENAILEAQTDSGSETSTSTDLDTESSSNEEEE